MISWTSLLAKVTPPAKAGPKVKRIQRLLLSPLVFVGGMIYVLFLTLKGALVACWPICLRRKVPIDGRVVLVTGSAGGIGREMALQLGQRGAKVVLWDIDAFENEVTATMITHSGGTAFPYTVDVGNKDDVDRSATLVEEEVGEVDFVINNAGVVVGKSLLDLSGETIRRTLDVNLLAHFWIIKYFLPRMIEKNSGHLVSVASVAGIVGTAKLTDYCASKFAIVGMMESLSVELRNMKKTGVKLLTVCPYYIKTGMFQGVQTRFQCLLPMLDPKPTACKIIAAMRTGHEVLYLPSTSYFLLALKGILPHRAIQSLGYLFGAHTSMNSFRGSFRRPAPKRFRSKSSSDARDNNNNGEQPLTSRSCGDQVRSMSSDENIFGTARPNFVRFADEEIRTLSSMESNRYASALSIV